ncbi:MAG: TRAP transporter fused permease subunit [Desulfobacterales bacterium]|nr:TRAP transporter fused permease subunit [Desulfobacterales bacterium]
MTANQGADVGMISFSVKEKDDVTGWLMSQRRLSFPFIMGCFFLLCAVFFCLYHLYTGYFGQPEAHLHRSIHLTLIFVMVFIMHPVDKKPWNGPMRPSRLIDLALILLTVGAEAYYLADTEGYAYRIAMPDTMDLATGVLVYLLVLEVTRRTVGWAMMVIALAFTLQALFSDRLLWILYGSPTFFETFIAETVMTSSGIFGIPISVMSSFVVLFLIFSALLIFTGAGRFFVNLAYAVAGTQVGGPAKAAVVSSMAFGTISGSTASDVVATGSFTIPLMKRLGYPSKFAGAVEAVASTGGAFMPPVMGAVAFIMSAFLGVSYFSVVLAAFIPALLYYSSLFLMVDFQSRKRRLLPIPREELPDFWAVLKWGVHLILPVIILVGMLAMNYSASAAASWSIAALFVVTLIKKESRLGPLKILKVFESAGKRVLSVSAACACAGIIISATTLSGVGLRLGQSIIAISGDSTLLALIFTMLFSIILGMGLTTTAVYITMVVTVIPIIIKLGVLPLAAHLFALYFGVLSNIVPPVAIAAFAASALAESNPMKTAITAFGIGIAGLMVPFAFVYNPELLLEGSAGAIVIAVVTSFIGVVGTAAAIQGWIKQEISVPWRLLLFAAAVASFSHIPAAYIPGAILICLYVLIFHVRRESPWKKALAG